MRDVETLKPFTRFLMTIGNLPSSYLVSMTYEEQLLWFCNFLQNNVIPVVNNNAEAVIELQNYVKNYFENLDVQEEINNKLDEMAESGELETIIGKYYSNEWEILQPYLGEELGECTIFRKDDFVLMYDTGYTGQDDLIKNYLLLKNISHIDVLIISHFHADHSGCTGTILNDYCDSNTRIYIGMIPDYDQFTINEEGSELRYTQFVELCEELNLTYSVPENNSTVTIGDIKLRFLNTDRTNLSTYYNSYSDSNVSNYLKSSLNNCSLVCEITSYSNKILLTGDIEQPAETAIKNYINEVDLMMIPHHNYNSYGDKDFFDNANPTLTFGVRGTSASGLYPYGSRYQHNVKDFRIIQNYQVPIEISCSYGKMVVNSGVDFITAFDNTDSTQLINFLPSVEHCLFDEVDLYDFSNWDSHYIFTMMEHYSDRNGFTTLYFRNGRYTALTAELDEIYVNNTDNEFNINVTPKYIDFEFGSMGFHTYRIYKGYTAPAQKYAILVPESFANLELTGEDITNTNVRNRNSFVAYVSDANTENVYPVPVYRLNSSIGNSQYIGYYQNLSSNRWLTLMKVEITFSGSTYTLNYYRMVFDKDNNTWSIYNTTPTLSKIRI